MTYINERLRDALTALAEELPMARGNADYIGFGLHKIPHRNFWTIDVHRKGMCFGRTSYPDDADGVIAVLDQALTAANNANTFTPREYAEAEFGPIFGKAAA